MPTSALGGSYQKYLKVSDGFFAHRDPMANTTLVFRPVSVLEPEMLVIVPTGFGGWTWFRLEKREQQIKVLWCINGNLFRSYRYQPNVLIYDFLLNIVDDVDLVEPGHRSKLFKFIDEETDSEIGEDQWRSPMRTLYRHLRPPPAPRVRPLPVEKPSAKPVAKAGPKPKASGVKKRPGKKA